MKIENREKVEKEIIKAMADCNMNIAEVSKKLMYHRNSIVYHIETIKENTGLDARVFYDLVKLLKGDCK